MKILLIIFLLVFLISCTGSKVNLPIETSLGKLVRIEQKDKVATDEQPISAEGGKVLYILSFEGKNELTYEGGEQDALRAFPLVDSKGTEFNSIFAGSPTNTGALSNKDWRFNGQLQGRNGKFVFVGALSIPSGKLMVVYSVPKDAGGLSLKDGERRHPIN